MTTELVKRSELVKKGGVTIKAAAEFLSVSEKQIYKFMADETLPFFYAGCMRRIPRVALEKYAEKSLHTSDAVN